MSPAGAGRDRLEVLAARGSTAAMSDMSPGDEAPPDAENAGEDICRRCNGDGKVDGGDCPECEGTGKVMRGVGGA